MRQRTVQPASRSARRRSVLLVLPQDAEGQHATWELVKRVDLEVDSIRPVGLGSTGVGVPDAFAGRVRVLSDADLDWRRLPKLAFCADLWAGDLEVAINLADPGHLAASLLVGASPASVRIGRHHADRELCYDLMIQGEATASDSAVALGRLLRRVDPPILPIP